MDLYTITANCEPHSRRNHNTTAEGQTSSLAEVWKALAYVRARQPKVVVMENVNEPSSVGPLTGLLGRLDGYRMEAGPLNPPTVAGVPMDRDRYFWLLTRK